ncbi:MAG: hypothetical protein ACLTWE_08120 [Dysgonomonas mossii]|uniref:hypothetical protein n=1 Tax=Dysgonomonas mossii TaxID=163665 RepID=UPI00399100F2
MERLIHVDTGQILIPKQRLPEKNIPEMKVIIQERDTTEPVRIGKLLEPIRQIIQHPDRNRLMAELFKDYK